MTFNRDLWPRADSEIAERFRALDWTSTPLGPIDGWPQSLKTIVDLMLHAPGMMSLVWGAEAIHLYNDSFTELLGEESLLWLGRSVHQTFARSHDVFAADLEAGLAAGMAGKSARLSGQRYAVFRNGRREDAWFDVESAPVHDEAGSVAGVLWTVKETTAQHRAEHALHASRECYRLLIESWAQASWETDASGRVVSDSPSWRAYTGQTLEEWLGYGWLDAIHPDDRAYAERQWRAAVGARDLVNAEFRLRTPDTGWRWTNVRAAPVLDAENVIERWVGLNIDIDASKRAEAALRESERRYRTLFESMDEAYAVVEVLKDPAGAWADFRFIEVNPAFVQHTAMPWPVGKRATDLLGTPNPRWTQLYGLALDTDAPIRVEEGEPTLDRIFDLSIFPLDRDRNRVAVLFTNITARKKVEAALRESEAQFRALADAAPALIWRNDANGENLFSNRMFSEFTGRPVEEIHGEGWHTLVHPDEVEAYVSDYLEAVHERRAWQNRTRIRRHDGQWRWFENYAQPLFGEDGTYLGHVGVSADITTNVEAEAALRESEERQTFLLKLSDGLRAEPHADAVANRALRMVLDHLQLDRCYITYYRPADDAADFSYQLGNDSVPPLPDKVRLSDFPDAYEQVLDRTFVVEDDFERRGLSEAERASSKALGMRAMVASTVRRGQKRPLCSMAAVSSRPRRWTPGEIALVEEAAERTWAAIAHARAEAALRASEHALAVDLANAERLRSLAERLVSEESIKAVYDEVLTATIAIARADAGTIQVYDPATKSLKLIASLNSSHTVNDHFHIVDAGSRTACGLALKTGARAFVDFPDEVGDLGCQVLVGEGLQSAVALPLVSRTGTPLGMLNAHWRTLRHRPSEGELRFLDLLARQAADLIEQRRAHGALRDSEERLRQFGDASSDVLWIRDTETLQWAYLTPAFETIYGLEREAALAGDNMTGWLDLIVPEDRQFALDSIQKVRAGERTCFEYRVRRPSDGQVRWLRNTDFPMRDAAGQVRWLGGVGRDISEEKAAIRRQEVLVNELQHRSRNLLGVVTAVAGRTLRQGGSVDAFEERLQALSRAQALLSQAGSDMVEVGALVHAELAAHVQTGSDRVRIAGPEVQLTARQVQNFALALHELTTNAVKYGALKDGTGWLAVTWKIVLDRRGRRRLALRWLEGGVAVNPETATRRGYGTELIQEALGYALEADVDYEIRLQGVHCRIEMPIHQPH